MSWPHDETTDDNSESALLPATAHDGKMYLSKSSFLSHSQRYSQGSHLTKAFLAVNAIWTLALAFITGVHFIIPQYGATRLNDALRKISTPCQ